jgi:hypothetical protein
MKTVVGNHVGIVVNVNDPENRGRVQVYVPHISTTLYNNWNEKLEDIEFKTFESTIFSGDIRERLLSLLPWAEAAVPVWGGGTGAPINTDTGEPTPFPTDRSFSYQGTTADYNKLFVNGKSDAGLSENMKSSLGGFAANFPNAKITSAKRDYIPEGGSQTSLHLSGNAIDIAMPVSPVEQEKIINWWLSEGGATEIGWEGNHIHVGFRQDGSKSVFWRNSPSEPIKTNLAGAPSFFQSLGTQFKSGMLARSNTTPKSNEPVSGKVNPKEVVASNGLERTDGKRDSTLLNQKFGNTSNMSDDFKTQYERVYDSLANTKFANMSKDDVPLDGAKYGVYNGTRQEWAHLFTRMALIESNFVPSTQSGPSGGLYQLGEGPGQAWTVYGRGNKYDPNDNTNAFVKYAEDLYFGGNTFGGNGVGGTKRIAFYDKSLPEDYGGISAGFGPLRKSVDGSFKTKRETWLLAENMPNAEQQKSDKNTINNIFRTTNQGMLATGSYNAGRIGGPAGMFSSPAVGSKVWVFFQAENPQRPVYFANVYEPSNAAAAGTA